MAKRFTDTEKWKKPWFRNLKPKFKAFWQYITDTCDHAGMWEVDFKLASYYIGTKIDEQEVREEFKKQYLEVDGGKRWFIRDFIEFQYGCLNQSNNAHKSVLQILKKRGVAQGLACPSSGALDMDKDKEMDKEKDTDSRKSIIFLQKVPSQELQELSDKYKISPRGIQSKATDLFLYCEGHGRRYKNYKAMLENALRKDQVQLRNEYPLPRPMARMPEETPETPEQKAKREKKMEEIREGMRNLGTAKKVS